MYRLLTRYSLVGVANTLVGCSVIFACLLAGTSGLAANIAGYAVGLICSFTLNRHYVFGARGAVSAREVAKFLAAFGLSYASNLIVLRSAQSVLGETSAFAQVPAIITYSLVFFIISHRFVFKRAGLE